MRAATSPSGVRHLHEHRHREDDEREEDADGRPREHEEPSERRVHVQKEASWAAILSAVGRTVRIGDAVSPDRVTAGAADSRHPVSVQRRPSSVEHALECLECGEASTETRGWKAFVDDELDLLVYCAACAEREFGE